MLNCKTTTRQNAYYRIRERNLLTYTELMIIPFALSSNRLV